MGYTHYWRERKDDGDKAWKRLLDRARKAIKLADVKIQYDYTDWDGLERKASSPPQIDYRAIRFNGIGEDGHETFRLDRAGESFTFCKTAQKPYDLLVTAILTIAQEELGLDVTSDGAMRAERYDGDGFIESVSAECMATMYVRDWKAGQDLAEKTRSVAEDDAPPQQGDSCPVCPGVLYGVHPVCDCCGWTPSEEDKEARSV